MRLLMISGDRLLASGKRGAFFETLSGLSRHYERIDIICPPSPVEINTTPFTNVFCHPAPRGVFSRFFCIVQPFWIAKKGEELFRKYRHGVMTVHDYPPFYNGLGARLLKRRIRIPAVLEIHHIVGWPEASSMSETIGRCMTQFFIGAHSRRFESVRVVNGTVKAQLAAWGVPIEKLSVVPSVYLDHEAISVAKNQEKKFDLVFAARLTDNKGLLPAIRSLVLLPQTTMLVIGDGLMRKKAEAFAESLGVSPRVTFAGWLPTPHDVLSKIASGRLFVMNSKSEGNPRVAIEAIALGVPVLATKVGIMPDVIQDGVNGVFTDGTSEDIALKADALLRNELKCASIGTEAMKVADRFEKKAAVKAYADFLKSFAR